METIDRVPVGEAKQHIGRRIRIAGWLQAIRRQGGIKFLVLRDLSGSVQAVVTKQNPDAATVADSARLESVVEVIGHVKEEVQAPGGFEISVDSLRILSLAEPELPIPVVGKGSEESELQKRLDYRWIDLRKPEKALIFKVWTAMEHAFREYCVHNKYVEIHSPKLMGAPSESGSELFEVKYFDRKAYLAQSPQFYKQMAMAAGFEKIFEVGPVFRADPSFTSRHATEFTGYDIEISFIESHEDVMREEERLLAYVLERVKEEYGDEIARCYGREVVVPSIPFPRMTMREAKETLAARGVPGEMDADLSPEEERALCDYVREMNGHEFVFVTEYPATVRAFYHMRMESAPSLTKSFDLLWNGLEITTGAQREHRHDILAAQAQEKGLSLEPIRFYLDFFKYGCPPHGGLGLGANRMLMKILDIRNVREVTYLYRGVKRLTP